MTRLFRAFEPQLQVVEASMHVGREREQIPEVMYIVRREELFDKAAKSEGPESGHSHCDVLRLSSGCG